MKKNLGIILSVALGLSALLLAIASLAGWVKASPARQEARAGSPTMVSYQGQVFDGNSLYNGHGYFKFAIMDSNGTTQKWSNDGANPPSASIGLTVSNGFFSVNLGDTTIYNMTQPLTSDAFNVPNTFLRVWFSPDDLNWTQISDQKIAAVPYALQAQMANYAPVSDFASQAMNADYAGYADIAGEATYAEFFGGHGVDDFQLRVTGSCPPGESVRVVNQDGSVICESISLPSFSISTIESTVNVGTTSTVIGGDGLALIGYYDDTNDNLKTAHCSNIGCTSATTSTIDSTGDVGLYSDIVIIDLLGRGLISYYDATNGALKAALCFNANCSTATIVTVDTTGDTGQYSSIAVGTDDLPLISYYDVTNGDLMVAHCNDIACNTATTYPLDTTGNVGQYTSLAIGDDGKGLISYVDTTNFYLKVAHCSDTTCSSATISILDTFERVGQETSIAIGIDGMGLISYHNQLYQALNVAHCDNYECSTATLSSIDELGSVGDYSSIAIGVDGLGLIGYRNGNDSLLKIAHCIDLSCSDATYYSLADSGNFAAFYISMAIGTDGMGLFSFVDLGSGDLRVAHCSNFMCFPTDGSIIP